MKVNFFFTFWLAFCGSGVYINIKNVPLLKSKDQFSFFWLSLKKSIFIILHFEAFLNTVLAIRMILFKYLNFVVIEIEFLLYIFCVTKELFHFVHLITYRYYFFLFPSNINFLFSSFILVLLFIFFDVLNRL